MKKNTFYIILLVAFLALLFICIKTMAQTEPAPKQKTKSCGCPFDKIEVDSSFYDEPLFTADENPSFPGGEVALKRYIERLVQYPAKNAEDSLKYSVFCLFVIEKDGSISHPKILHHSDSIFEQETLRFVQTMPKWKPGKSEGNPVRCWHSIKLHFGYPNKQ